MDSRVSRFDAAKVRVTVAVALLSFVGELAVPSEFKIAPLIVMVTASLGVLVCSLGWIFGRSGSAALGGVAAGSAVGLVGSVLYLRSLADEPSAIPLAGSFVLLLSLIGLVVSTVLLRDRSDLCRRST
ncbi:MAG: hypothetical protein M3130_07605 [Actinomycetota bacterium]|nr:hypothetical protein [Actinomycetota bacterium]